MLSLKHAAPWKKSYDQSRQHIKKLRLCFGNKGPYSQSYSFSSSHVQVLELFRLDQRAQHSLCEGQWETECQ